MNINQKLLEGDYIAAGETESRSNYEKVKSAISDFLNKKITLLTALEIVGGTLFSAYIASKFVSKKQQKEAVKENKVSSGRIHKEREHHCDEHLLKMSRKRRSYSDALSCSQVIILTVALNITIYVFTHMNEISNLMVSIVKHL